MHSTRSSRTPPCTCQDKPMPQLSRRQLVGLSISTLLPVHAATAEMKWDKPREQDIETVQRAIRAFDSKRLTEAESLFSSAIESWKGMNRPRDELAELFKFRANARVDLKRFSEAKQDYDTVLAIMEEGEKQSEKNGKATYMEYPDTFVQRGLCSEGLGKWEDAIADYSRAIQLWGGGREQGVNPYVLTFRANALAKLGRYSDALLDYEAADRMFVALRDEARALDVRANYALARYQVGQTKEATKMMTDIVRRNPGYTDMHVALAAIAWSAGDRETAESEWEFACNKIQTGCSLYRDMDWLSTVRRWPPSMVANMKQFLGKK